MRSISPRAADVLAARSPDIVPEAEARGELLPMLVDEALLPGCPPEVLDTTGVSAPLADDVPDEALPVPLDKAVEADGLVLAVEAEDGAEPGVPEAGVLCELADGATLLVDDEEEAGAPVPAPGAGVGLLVAPEPALPGVAPEAALVLLSGALSALEADGTLGSPGGTAGGVAAVFEGLVSGGGAVVTGLAGVSIFVSFSHATIDVPIATAPRVMRNLRVNIVCSGSWV